MGMCACSCIAMAFLGSSILNRNERREIDFNAKPIKYSGLQACVVRSFLR